MAKISVAWANLVHERTRLLVAIAGIAFAVLMIFLNLGLMGVLIATSTKLYEQFNADLFLISSETLELSISKQFLRDVLPLVVGLIGVAQFRPLNSAL